MTQLGIEPRSPGPLVNTGTPLRNVTLLYHKPIFTGLYTRWESFRSSKQKSNLIKILIHTTTMIWSESTLDTEIKFISETLCNNGFPFSIVQTVIINKTTEFNKIKLVSTQKCPFYLHLHCLGGISERLAKQITQNVQRCYFSSNVRVVFHTKPILTSIRKDVLLAHHNNSLIYLFKCSCSLRKNKPKARC